MAARSGAEATGFCFYGSEAPPFELTMSSFFENSFRQPDIRDVLFYRQGNVAHYKLYGFSTWQR